MIITLFDHVSEAHAHASFVAACVSSLGKIIDPHTFDAVLRALARPMVQSGVGPEANNNSRGTTGEDQQDVWPMKSGTA